MTDPYLKAAYGDKWLAGILARAVRLVREGKGFTLLDLPDGRRWAAGYIVRAFGLTP